MSEDPPSQPPAPPDWPSPDASGPAWSWSDAGSLDAAWAGPAADDRYLRGARLHEGPMSVVQLAEDPLLRRQVVLKCAPGDADGPAALRLLRESRITAALDLPGVPPVLDAGVDSDGRQWFAMPVLHGETLADRLAKNGPGMAHLTALIAAARVVAGAHRLGIVHRDLKPEHILLDGADAERGQVRVLDWGIARPASASSEWDTLLSLSEVTGQGQVVGTPAYMAPEQVIGEAIGPATDVWALGVCLAELLTGRAPFLRDTPAETLRAVVHDPAPEVAGPLAAVVARCLHRDPLARFPHADAVADALAEALRPPPTPAPSRRTPLAAGILVAGVCGALLGWALAPGAPAPLDPVAVSASPAVGRTALRAHARHLLRTADPEQAALFAAAGLADGEDALLRGVLAARGLPVVHADTKPLPTCESTVLSGDGRSLLCIGADAVSVVDTRSGRTRWQRPVTVATACVLQDHLMAWTPNNTAVRIFDLQSGAGVDGPASIDAPERSGASPHPDRCYLPFAGGSRRIDRAPGARLKRSSTDALGIAISSELDLHVSFDAYRFVDPDTGEVLAERPRGPVHAGDRAFWLATAPEAGLLVEGSLDGLVRVLPLDGHDGPAPVPVALPKGAIHDVALSSSGTWVAAVDEQSRAWLWPRSAPGQRQMVPGKASAVGFIGDDTLVAVGEDRRLFTLGAPHEAGRLSLDSGVTAVDLHGDHLAIALGNGEVQRRHLPSGRIDRVMLDTVNVAKDITLGPGGRAVAASLSTDSPSRWLWPESEATRFGAFCRRTVFVGDTLSACQPVGMGGPLLLDAQGRTFPQVGRATAEFYDTEPLPDRQAAVLVDRDGEVWTLTPGDPPSLDKVAETGRFGAVAMASLSGPIYLARRDHIAVVWPDGSRPPARIPVGAPALDLALSPDGGRLAAAELTGDVQIFDTAALELVATLPGHGERAVAVGFSDDGRTLATGSWDHTARLWDLTVLDAPADRLVAEVEARTGRLIGSLTRPE